MHMNNKEKMLNSLHKLFRKDPYINELLKSSGEDFDSSEEKIESIEKEMFFDTMTSIGIKIYSKEMDYIPQSQNLEGQRTEIEARWKTSGKSDLKLLQTIADTYRNGEIKVLFINGVLDIRFISLVGIPDNIEILMKLIDEAKPAHIPYKYSYIYRLWRMLPPKTWQFYNNYTWKDVMQKEGI